MLSRIKGALNEATKPPSAVPNAAPGGRPGPSAAELLSRGPEPRASRLAYFEPDKPPVVVNYPKPTPIEPQRSLVDELYYGPDPPITPTVKPNAAPGEPPKPPASARRKKKARPTIPQEEEMQRFYRVIDSTSLAKPIHVMPESGDSGMGYPKFPPKSNRFAKNERADLLILMVGAAGLEPATLGLEGRCSIHLSYAPLVFCSILLCQIRRSIRYRENAVRAGQAVGFLWLRSYVCWTTGGVLFCVPAPLNDFFAAP